MADVSPFIANTCRLRLFDVELYARVSVESKNPRRENVSVAVTGFFSDDAKLTRIVPSDFALSLLKGLERTNWTLSRG